MSWLGDTLRSGGAAARRWASRSGCPDVPAAEQARADYQAARLRLPTSEAPKVSVIIPVYGKFQVTWHCLRALAEVPAGVAHEVIVVDDRSPDETGEMLATVDGLRVHTNAVNLGFIGACNAGAAQARGEWLVFLNNDTWLSPGWLAALVDTFQAHPKAGIVGARLLFPDGKLQECGGVVFRDGRASHYGRNRWPGGSAYAYLREADYVSGACLAISKALFDTLEGFDAYYAPAYYEDTDLCFRARAAGYQVLVQPACTVFHFEGWTHGKSKNSKAEQLMATNRGRFVQRWQDVLRRHPTPGERSRRSAERARGSQLLLYAQSFSAPLLDLATQARALGYRVAWLSPTALPAEVAGAGIEPLTPPEHPSLAHRLRARTPPDVLICADAPPPGIQLRKLAPQLCVLGVDATLDPQLDARIALTQDVDDGGLNLPVFALNDRPPAERGQALQDALQHLSQR